MGYGRYAAYRQTIHTELAGIKDRFRRLVAGQWKSDGTFKETILRHVLRRHLPESLIVGTGFIVFGLDQSGEVDILVTDRTKPTLFKEGDLLVVTPDCVKAIIEVKTSTCTPQSIRKAVFQVAERKKVCQGCVDATSVWAGCLSTTKGSRAGMSAFCRWWRRHGRSCR